MNRIRKRSSYGTKGRFKQSRYEGGPRKVILPIFEPSGLLELESNNREGVQLKHVEPSDAQSPNDYWNKYNIPIKNRSLFQLMVYKKNEDKLLNEYNLDKKSSYIVGRALGRSLDQDINDKTDDNDNEEPKEVVIADIKIPEETCSKQHCVVQFREMSGDLKVYVMDLDSSNGTILNGVVLPRARYIELRSGDILVPSSDEDSEYEIVFVSQ